MRSHRRSEREYGSVGKFGVSCHNYYSGTIITLRAES